MFLIRSFLLLDPTTDVWHPIPEIKVDTGSIVTTLPENLLQNFHITPTGDFVNCTGAFGPPVTLAQYYGSMKVEGMGPVGVYPIVPNQKKLLGTNVLQFFTGPETS